MSQKRTKVAVVFGGRSGEHEISLISAASVIRNLDPAKYEVVPIAIDRDGRWRLNDTRLIEEARKQKSLPVFKDAPEVVLQAHPSATNALTMVGAKTPGQPNASFDVVFPVMHGTYCEDGTLQGLLELADVPYVGCGVLSSAIGMDKEVAKKLARDAGIPVVPFIAVRKGEWAKQSAKIRDRAGAELGYPLFVKPVNAGSSLGVHKVKSATDFETAMNDAFRYDLKVLIEKAVPAREIEFAVMENPVYGEPPLVSTAGEINPRHEFYSYEAKYFDENGAELLIPAKLDASQLKQAQELARSVFVALECEGMARVDLFLDRESGAFYLNEINTIPGFTHISMYPKLWEATGIAYADLLSRLIDLAIARHGRKSKLLREYQK